MWFDWYAPICFDEFKMESLCMKCSAFIEFLLPSILMKYFQSWICKTKCHTDWYLSSLFSKSNVDQARSIANLMYALFNKAGEKRIAKMIGDTEDQTQGLLHAKQTLYCCAISPNIWIWSIYLLCATILFYLIFMDIIFMLKEELDTAVILKSNIFHFKSRIRKLTTDLLWGKLNGKKWLKRKIFKLSIK